MKRGRKPDSGVVSGINPKRDSWTDIRSRIIYGTAEWRIVRLRQLLISDGSKRPDNYLSMRAAENQAKARTFAESRAKQQGKPRAAGYVQTDEIDSLWRDLSSQFQRAVLNGDADWFERQAKTIKKGGLPHRVQFNAKVVHLLENAMWGTHAGQGDNREDLTLTPARKFTNAMAHDIYAALEPREMRGAEELENLSRKKGYKSKNDEPALVVEGCQFESKERVMEAIHDLAKRIQFKLRKQARAHYATCS